MTTGTGRWSLKLDAGVNVGTTSQTARVIVGTDAGEIIALGAAGPGPGSCRLDPIAGTDAEPDARAGHVFVGELAGAPDGLSQPLDTAVDPAGRTWVVESGRSGFAIFDSSGAFL